VASSPIPIIAFADLEIETLQLTPAARNRSAARKSKKR
jgi:hypothetical protein